MIAGFPFIIVNLQTNLECGCCPQPNICHIQTCELCLKMFKFNRTLSTESAFFLVVSSNLDFHIVKKKLNELFPLHAMKGKDH